MHTVQQYAMYAEPCVLSRCSTHELVTVQMHMHELGAHRAVLIHLHMVALHVVYYCLLCCFQALWLDSSA
jgi:hypothetical protein